MNFFNLLCFSLLFSFSLWAAPVPSLTLAATSTTPLKGEQVQITFSLDNTSGADLGYFPYFRFIIPEGLSYASVDSCNGLGTPTIKLQTGSLEVDDDYTTEKITLTNTTDTFLTILPTIGQITPSQPVYSCTLTFNMTAAAAVGTDIDIYAARGIFAIGGLSNGEALGCLAGDTICSAASTLTITPTLIEIEVAHGSPNPSGSGEDSIHTFTISGDLASGETITNIIMENTIPEMLSHTIDASCVGITFSTPPTSCAYVADVTATTGGKFTAHFTTLSADFTASFTGFIKKIDDAATAIIPADGSSVSQNNTVSFLATEVPVINESASITARSLHLKASTSTVNDLGGANSGGRYTPNDVIKYTYDIAVSDYFTFEDPEFTFELSDGLTYNPSSFNVVIQYNNTSVTVSGAALDGYLTVDDTPGDGTTSIVLDMNAAMTASVFGVGFTNGKFIGSESFGGYSGTTSRTLVTIEYNVTIDESFESAAGSLDALDQISSKMKSKNIEVDGTGVNFPYGVADNIISAAKLSILALSSSKEIVFINDVAAGGGSLHLKADDKVTFKLSVVVPDGGVEGLLLEDFLPAPIFAPTGDGVCLAYHGSDNTVPDENKWNFRANEIGIASADVTVSCNASNNKISFSVADYDYPSGDTASKTVEIEFSLPVSVEPISDGLQLVNLVFMGHEDSFGVSKSTVSNTIDFIIDAPFIESSFEIVSTDGTGTIADPNITDVDADDKNIYKLSLENTGEGAAQAVSVTIPMGSGYINPDKDVTCTDSGADNCGYLISVSAGCTGFPVFTTSTQTQIFINGITIATGATCEINFSARMDADIISKDELELEATTVWTNGGTSFSPVKVKSKATVVDPTNTMVNNTSETNGEAGDELDGWEDTVLIPEGEFKEFTITMDDNAWLDITSGTAVVSITKYDKTFSGATWYCVNDVASFVDNVCFEKDPTDSTNHSNINAGDDFKIDLGRTINGYTSNLDADHEVIFTINDSKISSGASAGAKTLKSTLAWKRTDNAAQTHDSNTLAFTILSPNLLIEKCAKTGTPALITVDSTVGYNIAIKNSGGATAFDLSTLVDTLATGLTYDAGSLSVHYCSTGAAVLTCATANMAVCTNITAASIVGATNIEVKFANDNNPANDVANGEPFIAADGFFYISFDADVNCTVVDDLASSTTIPSHPNNTHGGYSAACANPMPYGDNFTNTTGTITYSTQLGDIDGEGDLTSAVSNTITLNLDHDGDGIANSLEPNTDSDGDGVPDYLDTDSDDNGVIDSSEVQNTTTPVDTDGDGTPDYRDLDNDGDGISDSTEIDQGETGINTDSDGDGLKDYMDPDSDNDGLADGAEGFGVNSDGTDSDNFIDRDSDNDGIPDSIEFGIGSCDTNGNGEINTVELATCSSSICIASPCDSDGNGAIELDEFVGGALPDSDGDGIPNYIDLDSDNDGISDLYENLISNQAIFTPEYINTNFDSNSDGRISGGSGPGAYTGEYATLAVALGGHIVQNNAFDFDGDGILNIYDNDSDNDGVPDIIENNRYSYDADDSGEVDYPGEFDTAANPSYITHLVKALLDTDSDGKYNYLDKDSDGDGIHDWIEAYVTSKDTNSDGSISDSEYTAMGSVLNYADLPDTDTDGTKDIYDLDSDGDTILDRHEALDPAGTISLWATLTDTDLDGTHNFRDLDSDADGFTDSAEAGDADLATAALDTDGDGSANYRDTDSDNDGLEDDEEAGQGTNRLSFDSDGDSCGDGCEVYGKAYGVRPGLCAFNVAPFKDQVYAINGSLALPYSNPTLYDSDGGGANDCMEANTPSDPNNAVGDPADTDGDKIPDITEGVLGTDPNVADTDGDGLSDGCEILGTNYPGTSSDCPWIGHAHGGAGSVAVDGEFTDPLDEDSDDGGMNDYEESQNGGNPNDDSDDDSDGDGIGNDVEIELGLDPNLKDTNGDCLNDGDEIGPDHNNPKDTDGDGVPDIFDIDNDGDGISDCEEIRMGLDPNSKKDVKIQGSGGFACSSVKAGTYDSGPSNSFSSFFSFLFYLLLIFAFRYKHLKKALFLMLIFSFIAPIETQAFDVQRYRPMPASLGINTASSSEDMDKLKYSIGLHYNYVVNPIEFGSVADERLDAIINKAHTLNLNGGFNYSRQLSFFADLPLSYIADIEPINSSESTSQFTKIGDIKLGMRKKIEDYSTFSLIPFIIVPTGDDKFMNGEKKVSFGLDLGKDWILNEDNSFSFNLGYIHREKQEFFNLTVKSAWRFNVGYRYNFFLFKDTPTTFFAEAFSERHLGDVPDPSVSIPIELDIGLKIRYEENQILTLGYGKGITIGYGSPDHRLFLGIDFLFLDKKEKLMEVIKAPKVVRKKYPKVPKSIISRIEVKSIYFFFAESKAKISNTFEVKDLVAIMKKYKTIKKVFIQGHTDSKGYNSYNITLSRSRAKVVYDYLINSGIDPRRLEVRGYGETYPVADNTTSEGRALNRRVDFKVRMNESTNR